MKITKVSYGKTYSLGNYCSERIDLEASVDESKESVTDAVFQLREYCDQLHKKNNPHLYQEQETITYNPIPIVKDEFIDAAKILMQTPSPTNKKLTQIELILQEIGNATTEKQLKEWRLLAEKHPEIMDIYYNKLSKLTEIQ